MALTICIASIAFVTEPFCIYRNQVVELSVIETQ